MVCIHEYRTSIILANLQTGSFENQAVLKQENFTLYSIISQLRHIITTKNL